MPSRTLQGIVLTSLYLYIDVISTYLACSSVLYAQHFISYAICYGMFTLSLVLHNQLSTTPHNPQLEHQINRVVALCSMGNLRYLQYEIFAVALHRTIYIYILDSILIYLTWVLAIGRIELLYTCCSTLYCTL